MCLIPLMNERAEPVRLAARLDVGQALEQLPEHHVDLLAGQVGAQAEVGPGRAEPDVGVGAPAYVEAVGVAKTSSSRLAEL